MAKNAFPKSRASAGCCGETILQQLRALPRSRRGRQSLQSRELPSIEGRGRGLRDIVAQINRNSLFGGDCSSIQDLAHRQEIGSSEKQAERRGAEARRPRAEPRDGA